MSINVPIYGKIQQSTPNHSRLRANSTFNLLQGSWLSRLHHWLVNPLSQLDFASELVEPDLTFAVMENMRISPT